MNILSKIMQMTGMFFGVFLLVIPAMAIADDPPGDFSANNVEIQYYKWLQNDLVRNIEEIRMAKHPEECRELIEDIEDDIYNKIEYPMDYKQAERTDELNLGRIGVTSDVVDAKEASPEAPEIAEAYALLGIAKGFEGFSAAAMDFFAKAKGIFQNVMYSTVSLDHNGDDRTLNAWVLASRGYWGESNATRVTFFGKKVSQQVVDQLDSDKIDIVRKRSKPGYTEYVARRDFVRGMKRYIQTDTSLPERKENRFQIYLPPGKYSLAGSQSGKSTAEFTVYPDPNQNRYIIETLNTDLLVHPVPDILDFEEKMQNMKRYGRPDDIFFPPEDEGMPSEPGLLDKEPL